MAIILNESTIARDLREKAGHIQEHLQDLLGYFPHESKEYKAIDEMNTKFVDIFMHLCGETFTIPKM